MCYNLFVKNTVTKFTPPNYDDFYIFKCEHGDVRCLKADYNYIRDERVLWIKDNPKPDPPLVPVTPSGKNWKLKHARLARELSESKAGMTMEEAEMIIAQKADPIADPDSPEYEGLIAEWGWRRFTFIEGILLSKYTLYETRDGMRTLEHIVVSENSDELVEDYLVCPTMEVINKIIRTQVRITFNAYFSEISTVTWAHVLAAGDRIGLTFKGNPVLRMIPQDDKVSGEEQSIYGLGILAAKDLSMSPGTFKLLGMVEQAEILAQYLIQRWLEKLNQMERQRTQNKVITNPEGSYRGAKH